MNIFQDFWTPLVRSSASSNDDDSEDSDYLNADHSYQLPLTRKPLQELAFNVSGELIHLREPTRRASPSSDQENRPPVSSDITSIQAPFPTLDDLGSTLDSIGDSSSDPDLSALTMSRAAPGLEHNLDAMAYEEETDHGALSQENYDADDTSVEDQDAALLMDPADLGLKEISNLAKFTVSSHKPGCGVAQLRSDDLKQFWQSDGPQPHKLTIYFVKRVGIREIRFHVDYNEDESYTPTKIVFKSGTSENNLIEFATMHLDGPVGWQQVPLNNAGGEPDGLTLVSWVLQMQILENHQNGKDTHLRGIKIYAHEGDTSAQDRISSALASQDFEIHEDVSTEARQPPGYFAHDDDLRDILDVSQGLAATRIDSNEPGFTIPDFMREPELR
ncbi:hypothetical protein CDD81_6147 [Ophiocordyceps australis]|uniref:DOC domain-containing protein n=1 Tax=Ophiocordyceps australis TaxID=1399860 RepID=A0A2C5Y774_9HYPO|nr:hypothetical protein CDD81_6147 [Ophiocordyceps australis]